MQKSEGSPQRIRLAGVTQFIQQQDGLRFYQIQPLSLQKFLFLLNMPAVQILQRHFISEQ